MSDFNIELCPETGICSIMKKDGSKVDLMPDEVEALASASGNSDAIKKVLSDVDPDFAESLNVNQLNSLSKELK